MQTVIDLDKEFDRLYALRQDLEQKYQDLIQQEECLLKKRMTTVLDFLDATFEGPDHVKEAKAAELKTVDAAYGKVKSERERMRLKMDDIH